ncbi:MAG: HlyD family efflux transporter periplasmic adaptor subunit [Bacteroidetes bacterium]|jgi:multidrug efflux pump subunit AcrA (membrane-fusion protein)|nr:HlyD family efflux transporter periplasmic adaptor subunit [Bacteroidota bacterium]MDA1382301.1 HlyD family efflux transporter periplasmic adaptor subunit [Bacteroidota bacterium]
MSPLLQKVLRLLAGVLILFVGFFMMQSLIGMKQSPSVTLPETMARPVRTTVVFNTQVTPKVPVEGRVQAWNRIDLFAEVNGVLSLMGEDFREGKSFKEGEVILNLDDSESRSNLKSARSVYLQLVTGMLASIQVDFPERIEIWEQYVESIDVTKALPSLPTPESKREEYFIVNRGVQASFYSIKASEERVSKFTVRAPFDGFVAQALVKPGALVRAGQPLGLFVGTDVYEIQTAVHSRYLATIKTGDKVIFHDENDLVVAEGKVDRIAGNVNASTQSATVFCKVRASENRQDQMRDGRYLSGFIESSEIENAFEIQRNLIDGEEKVFVVNSNELEKMSVVQEFRSIETAIVSGMPNGTLILSDPVTGAYLGMPVSVGESIVE